MRPELFHEEKCSPHVVSIVIPYQPLDDHTKLEHTLHTLLSISGTEHKIKTHNVTLSLGPVLHRVLMFLHRTDTDLSLMKKLKPAVSFGNENEDGIICPYLCLTKLHDNFPVGNVVYLLKAEVNR